MVTVKSEATPSATMDGERSVSVAVPLFVMVKSIRGADVLVAEGEVLGGTGQRLARRAGRRFIFFVVALVWR